MRQLRKSHRRQTTSSMTPRLLRNIQIFCFFSLSSFQVHVRFLSWQRHIIVGFSERNRRSKMSNCRREHIEKMKSSLQTHPERYFQTSHSERIQRATRYAWRILYEQTAWFSGDNIYKLKRIQLPVLLAFNGQIFARRVSRRFFVSGSFEVQTLNFVIRFLWWQHNQTLVSGTDTMEERQKNIISHRRENENSKRRKCIQHENISNQNMNESLRTHPERYVRSWDMYVMHVTLWTHPESNAICMKSSVRADGLV